MSKKIQDYISARGDTNIVRCCVTGWKKKIYEEKMPEGELGECWKALPHSEEFTPDDEVWSLCPNCMNIVQEWRGVKQVHSLWELIDHDDKFPFPNLSGLQATLQDCLLAEWMDIILQNYCLSPTHVNKFQFIYMYSLKYDVSG